MTPADLIAARKALDLTAADLGRALRLEGRDPGQTVRRWETGVVAPIPGPAQVAVELMLKLKGRKQSWRPSEPPPADQVVPLLEDEKPAAGSPGPAGLATLMNPPKTRRRGA
jgi:hypothetical protein